MARDGRSERLKKWFRRAEAEQDIFDRYIYGWLALGLAASIHETASGKRFETDRERVNDYLKNHANDVEDAARIEKSNIASLSMRTGTRNGVIVDGPQRLQEHCKRFRRKTLGQGTCSAEEFAESTAEILNKVRNNLFHGEKVYDDATDRDLLQSATPLLLAIISACERLKGTRRHPIPSVDST